MRWVPGAAPSAADGTAGHTLRVSHPNPTRLVAVLTRPRPSGTLAVCFKRLLKEQKA